MYNLTIMIRTPLEMSKTFKTHDEAHKAYNFWVANLPSAPILLWDRKHNRMEASFNYIWGKSNG